MKGAITESTARMSFAELTELHKIDQQRMEREFYGRFDQSRILQFLENSQHSESQEEFLGSGTHFKTLGLRHSSLFSSNKQAMEFVAKIPIDSHFQKDHPDYFRFLEALSHLKRVKDPLIPPFELVFWRQTFAMVMPRGKRDQNVSRHWQPLDLYIDISQECLLRRGLKIDDHSQVAHWQGVPFLYDLSDLKQSQSLNVQR
jgi:hypothetical protein